MKCLRGAGGGGVFCTRAVSVEECLGKTLSLIRWSLAAKDEKIRIRKTEEQEEEKEEIGEKEEVSGTESMRARLPISNQAREREGNSVVPVRAGITA